ncbi:hypothetical protein [Deinococcus wulumuqiensis]|uniref:hypothetical protein n=1 Tax=Deinococcus wulumuqiensis TaxID=980427 RepID=UPI0024305F53|nr:hypothetical protein [Deinococcus wulumuqiensis]
MYKTRPLGFKQVSYERYTVSKPDDSMVLIYANNSGKYIGMVEHSLHRWRTQFIVFGN